MDLYFARELYEMSLNASDMELDQLEYVAVEGWVRTNRDNGQVGFIELNDGSFFKSLQIVCEAEALSNFDEAMKAPIAAALKIDGQFVLTPDAKQPFELKAKAIEIEADSAADYPLQKKRHHIQLGPGCLGRRDEGRPQ